MNISECNIDSFYQTVETEKTNILNKMKMKNIDDKELRKLNKLLSAYNSLQVSLLKIRLLIRPSLE